jgi:hypothetical protein
VIHTTLCKLNDGLCICGARNVPHPAPLGGDHWLRKIEALKPGDPCEFKYPARKYWTRAIVVENGMSGGWSVETAEEKTARSSP